MVLAQGLTEQSSSAKHTLGQTYKDAATGKEYVYCQAGATLSQYDAVVISPAFSATKLTKDGVDTNNPVGVTPIDVTNGYYFWAQIYGAATVNAKALCAANVPLYSSATAGYVDDDPTGQSGVHGIVLSSAVGASDAPAGCFLNYALKAM